MKTMVMLVVVFTSFSRGESLYKFSPLVDGGITAASTAAAIIPYAFASQWIKLRCPCDTREINGLDRGIVSNHSTFAATFSDALLGTSLLLPAIADAHLLGFKPELVEDYAIYAETLAISAGLVSVVKVVVQRPIPRAYAGDPDAMQNQDGYRSFYSGHVTLAVSALSAASFTLSRRYNQKVWPWIVTGGVGVAVGAARIAAGNHFYTDVIVGMAVGATVGTVVPWLHSVSGGELALIPTQGGFQLTWGHLL